MGYHQALQDIIEDQVGLWPAQGFKIIEHFKTEA